VRVLACSHHLDDIWGGGGGSPYQIWSGEEGKETIEEGIFSTSTFLYRDKEIIGAGYLESFSAYCKKG
jgi:hypothetical protein